MKITRFKCQECGKITAGKKPKNGDGTLMYPSLHYTADKLRYCEGMWSEAEWVVIEKK